MNGWDYWIAIALGYVSVPIAAMLNRQGWPSKLRFFVAAGLALGAAVAQLAISGIEITRESLLLAFGPLFTAQQATFHLEVPGAGSPEVVARAEATLDKPSE